LSAFTKSRTNLSNVPPIPKLSAKEKQRLEKSEPTKKRDELWTAFRNLEADYQKYGISSQEYQLFADIKPDFKASLHCSRRMSFAPP
jgi:hypothetical protein